MSTKSKRKVIATTFNYKLFDKIIRDKKMTTTSVSQKTGIHSTTISHMRNGTCKYDPGRPTREKLAIFFNVPADYFDMPESKVNTEKTSDDIKKSFLGTAKAAGTASSSKKTTTQPAKLAAKEKPKAIKANTVADTSHKLDELPSMKVYECFATINHNIIEHEKYVTALFASMSSKMDMLLEKVTALEEKLATAKPEQTKTESKEKNLPQTVISNIKNYIDGYDASDDYQTFKKKIDVLCAYVRMNSDYEKNTSVLSAAYQEANKTYGMVMVDVRKEYYDKLLQEHNITKEELDHQPSNLRAIYEQEIYRSIIYTILSEMAEAIYNQKNAK